VLLISVGVPIGMWASSQRPSGRVNRTQPWDSALLTLEGLGVPWRPYPSADNPIQYDPTGLFGPGLIVMEADNDAGAVSTYVQAGAQYGTRLLWILLLLLPVTYFIQEMVVRLGIATGKGHAAMIYQRFGRWWGMFSLVDLQLVNVGAEDEQRLKEEINCEVLRLCRDLAGTEAQHPLSSDMMLRAA